MSGYAFSTQDHALPEHLTHIGPTTNQHQHAGRLLAQLHLASATRDTATFKQLLGILNLRDAAELHCLRNVLRHNEVADVRELYKRPPEETNQ